MCSHYTVDGAVKALKAAPEVSAERTVEPDPEPAPAPEPAVLDAQPAALDAEPAAVVEAVAVEVDPTAGELRYERLERLAIRTEDINGEVVDGWAEKFDRQAVREREHVAAAKAAAKREQALKRKLRDISDALVSAPGCPTCDDVLARFWSVARPAA